MNYAEEIRNLVNMKEVLSRYGFTPNPRGFICCPFHHEKTPSFGIYQNGQRWKCFGCGEGGSVIDFVMKYANLSYKQAVVKINYDFNLHLPIGGKRLNPKERMTMETREREIAEERKKTALEKKKRDDEYDLLLEQYAERDKLIMERKRQHPDKKYLIEICERDDAYIIAQREYISYLLDTF